MRVNGIRKTVKTVRVFKFGLMDLCTKAIGKTIRPTEEVV